MGVSRSEIFWLAFSCDWELACCGWCPGSRSGW